MSDDEPAATRPERPDDDLADAAPPAPPATADLSPAGLWAERRGTLAAQLRDGWDQAPADARGFAARLMTTTLAVPNAVHLPRSAATRDSEMTLQQLATATLREIPDTAVMVYGGAPAVAAAGFALGAGVTGLGDVPTLAERFLAGLERLRSRQSDAQRALGTNHVLLLGLADGIAALRRHGRPATPEAEAWVGRLVEAIPPTGATAQRLRDLAADLLDGRGRLRASVDGADVDAVASELALRDAWPTLFVATAAPAAELGQRCLRRLLFDPPPTAGDLAWGASAWCALEALARASVATLAPKVDTLVTVLERTQTAVRRWAWEERPRTAGATLAQWRLDNEYHVQAMLWAMLYPIFGGALRDEEYLESFGFSQPRADLIVTTLRSVIEVKFARQPRDLHEIEEQVAGDLGLYFANPARLDHMLVYVYDDAEQPQPEEYDRFRHALLARDERIRAVVVVQRPSQIPNRAARRVRGNSDARRTPEPGDASE